MPPELMWGAIIAAGVVVEAHALLTRHDERTLSAMVRKACRTEHPAGRVAFTIGTAVLAVWFRHHIVSWQRSS